MASSLLFHLPPSVMKKPAAGGGEGMAAGGDFLAGVFPEDRSPGPSRLAVLVSGLATVLRL
jgi:hypothetical protein